MRPRICSLCGNHEDDHHAFTLDVPDGCHCDPGEWVDGVTEICAAFDNLSQNAACRICEHDYGCHALVTQDVLR